MGSFISRNGLASLVFLGLIMFGLSRLVGSEGEDGLLMKISKDFTGENEAQVADEAKPATAVQSEAAAPQANPPISEFFEDDELIDTAEGFDPSPTTKPSASNNDDDEAMIVQQSNASQSVQTRPIRTTSERPPGRAADEPIERIRVEDDIH